MFCPHYDVVGSNGVSRSTDFTNILRSNHSGSVGSNGEFVQDDSGKPGAWLLKIDCESGELVRSLIPISGLVSSILSTASFIVNTSTLIVARAQNPDDGLPAAWNVTDS